MRSAKLGPELVARAVTSAFEQVLALELEALAARLRRKAGLRGKPSRPPRSARVSGAARRATPARQVTPERAPQDRHAARRRRLALVPHPDPSASSATAVLAELESHGVRGARLVDGMVVPPGVREPQAHMWVEVGDEVHDHTLGENRNVWPRELFYLVFRVREGKAA